MLPGELWPDAWRGTEEEAREIYDRLCDVMEIAVRPTLRFVEDAQMPTAVGHYDAAGRRPTIRLKSSQLQNPLPLTATLAHELSHDILLGGGHQSGEEHDMEWTTDLLPVVFGLGLFAANATIRFESKRSGNWEMWEMERHGYLPSRIFGYAFALLTYFRDEVDPNWIEQLRPDAAVAYRAGLRYLDAGGESLFHPDHYTANPPPPTTAALIRRLEHKKPSFRLAAFWDIERFEPSLIDAIVRRLRDRDPYVASEAARALAEAEEVSEEGRAELLRLLETPEERVKLGAIHAVGRLRIHPLEAIDALRRQIFSPSRDVALAAIDAVGRFGLDAEMLAVPLVKVLELAHIRGEQGAAEAAGRALWNIEPSPLDLLEQVYADGDRELLRLARITVEGCRPPVPKE